jgi:hypothetical protein
MTSAPAAAAHFPPQGESAGAARRFVATTLEGWGLDGLEETACLLVSELVSNVVLHAETDLEVHLLRSDGRVRVEVHDLDPHLPQRKFYSPTSATGRGMVFIAELSTAWGADPTPDGKVVWFELDVDSPPAPEVLAPGAEFRLEDWEDWEDWDDLTQTVIADDPQPETSARGHGPSSHTLVLACWP